MEGDGESNADSTGEFPDTKPLSINYIPVIFVEDDRVIYNKS